MDASHSTKRALTYSSTSDDEEENHPTFEVVMTDSYINYDDLYIPRKIYKHFPPTVEIALLHYRGKEWFESTSVGDRRRFKEGWKLFVLDNYVKRGFVVKFTLVDVSSLYVDFNVEVKGEGTSDRNPVEID
ncbi:PREDICTED: uncharacterized protein LOC109239567 [Nicotiana attenuata]|uniref:TF-B3 domain-containing protein n=1 Tax=Nicotiana attenuata TaxID=49451 RepID=A0A314L9L1_NICAT|nr:PREDICTED: uncharacterized protein LOC109239567 [Nicotiana attenuata]OIT38316.1 hypothetical protein A4A49_32871 [Nicotiana attenuata]